MHRVIEFNYDDSTCSQIKNGVAKSSLSIIETKRRKYFKANILFKTMNEHISCIFIRVKYVISLI